MWVSGRSSAIVHQFPCIALGQWGQWLRLLFVSVFPMTRYRERLNAVLHGRLDARPDARGSASGGRDALLPSVYQSLQRQEAASLELEADISGCLATVRRRQKGVLANGSSPQAYRTVIPDMRVPQESGAGTLEYVHRPLTDEEYERMCECKVPYVMRAPCLHAICHFNTYSKTRQAPPVPDLTWLCHTLCFKWSEVQLWKSVEFARVPPALADPTLEKEVIRKHNLPPLLAPLSILRDPKVSGVEAGESSGAESDPGGDLDDDFVDGGGGSGRRYFPSQGGRDRRPSKGEMVVYNVSKEAAAFAKKLRSKGPLGLGTWRATSIPCRDGASH